MSQLCTRTTKPRFPRRLADRERLADLLRERLPWAHVIAGAPGVPFISIRPEPVTLATWEIMWDKDDFAHPSLLKHLRPRPGQTERMGLVRTITAPPVSGLGWLDQAAEALAAFAREAREGGTA